MANFSLSANDICRIIKQCHTSGVQDFEFQGMKFTFHPRRNGDAVSSGQASDHTQHIPVVSETSEANHDVELMDQEAMLEAEEAQMLIDDPLAFEKAQIDRHIERARTMNEKT
jgi:hypothetical protein